MNAAAEGTDLSGHCSSGSSFLSAADYMAGSALGHMPGPSPMAMVMIAQESTAAAAADPGLGVSAGAVQYPVPVSARPAPSLQPLQESPAHVPLPESSESSTSLQPEHSTQPAPTSLPPPSFVSSTTPAAGMNRGVSTSSAMPRTQATSTKVANPESEKKPQKSVHSGKSSRSRKSAAKSASSKSSMSRISSRVSSSRSSRSGASEVALVMMRQQEAALNQVRADMAAELRGIRLDNQQQTASLMERLQRSEKALAAERESRRRDAEVAEARVAAAVKVEQSPVPSSVPVPEMGRGTLIPPEAPLPSAALDAATAAVLAAAEEVKAESEGIAQSTNAHLAAFEDQLRNVTSAYLQKCALAQKVQRENDARLRQQSTSVPESSGKATATSRTSCDKFAGRSPTYIGQQQVAADSLAAAQLQATIQAPSQVVKREMGPGETKPTETRETRSSEMKTRATGGTGSSETKRGRQPKAATQTRSSVAAVKEENSEETKSSAKGVARDSASGSGHVPRYSGKSANKKSSQKHKRGKRIRGSKRPGGDPSSSDSSSSGSLSSSESSSGSDSDWERGLADELAPATVPAANGQSYTFRPYIQYGAVEMFDPHAKLEDRVN
ncbi:hypothetical protein PHYSODRAFT_334309 [Phytophthora sojae]|uniref:Uncharacterized protein n=1 Tax=Phytophthora sojae (strain P6497) TaxID=1094619 RepID=G4ZP43_PHYSP|nr:hypothetical protein PHYSODRAFT_334309 [Phytophthora sojae]EGZ16120.1 hypothetical protein PHYSODRAFT_334309 [Phytophthora sojae]|eukprot:XP_009529869.1 hypothetical protein PHYSODRAFT_334309 [Phytophthora sojae]